MPLYLGYVAPYCPLSRDQQPPPLDKVNLYPRTTFIRPTIPTPKDLESAITSANIARSIVNALVYDRIINNTKEAKAKLGKNTPDKFKNKVARWAEVKTLRIKRYYKYFAKTPDGEDDKDKWVIVERLERMVWYDRVWKSYLTWEYGNSPNEGKPVKGALG